MFDKNFDFSKINSLISQIQTNVACDYECQKEKKSKLLKTKWDIASENLIVGPTIEQNAEKNYVTFTEGTNAYNELLDKKLTAKGREIAKEYDDKFEKLKIKVNLEIHSYSSILLNFKNVVDLYLKYKEENIELSKKLKETSNDILTNERKTYYKDEEIHHLKFYYYHIILVIYIICVFFFGFCSLVYPSKMSKQTRIGTFIVLVILPFFSTYIFGLILYLYKSIISALPNILMKNKFFSFT